MTYSERNVAEAMEAGASEKTLIVGDSLEAKIRGAYAQEDLDVLYQLKLVASPTFGVGAALGYTLSRNEHG